MEKVFELLKKRMATNLLFSEPITSSGYAGVMNARCDCDCTAAGNCNCSRCDW